MNKSKIENSQPTLQQHNVSGSGIDWQYFFGGSSGRTFDRYYKAEINGKRVEKHASNRGVKYAIGNIDEAKKKYKTEKELRWENIVDWFPPKFIRFYMKLKMKIKNL